MFCVCNLQLVGFVAGLAVPCSICFFFRSISTLLRGQQLLRGGSSLAIDLDKVESDEDMQSWNPCMTCHMIMFCSDCFHDMHVWFMFHSWCFMWCSLSMFYFCMHACMHCCHASVVALFSCMLVMMSVHSCMYCFHACWSCRFSCMHVRSYMLFMDVVFMHVFMLFV